MLRLISHTAAVEQGASCLFSVRSEQSFNEVGIELPRGKLRIGQNPAVQRDRRLDAFNDEHLQRPLHPSGIRQSPRWCSRSLPALSPPWPQDPSAASRPSPAKETPPLISDAAAECCIRVPRDGSLYRAGHPAPETRCAEDARETFPRKRPACQRLAGPRYGPSGRRPVAHPACAPLACPGLLPLPRP